MRQMIRFLSYFCIHLSLLKGMLPILIVKIYLAEVNFTKSNHVHRITIIYLTTSNGGLLPLICTLKSYSLVLSFILQQSFSEYISVADKRRLFVKRGVGRAMTIM